MFWILSPPPISPTSEFPCGKETFFTRFIFVAKACFFSAATPSLSIEKYIEDISLSINIYIEANRATEHINMKMFENLPIFNNDVIIAQLLVAGGRTSS